MARDGKLTLRFLQSAFNSANLFAVTNYGNSSTVASSGATITATATGTSGIWYRGTTRALNRAGFRDTNADQSILVSGETSAILNDPAIFGGTSATERWLRMTYAPVGPLAAVANVLYEIEVEAASDSGTGTAGTDWTIIGGSIPVNPIPGYAAVVSSGAGVVNGVVTLTNHGLTPGTVLVPQASATAGYVATEPLFVVARDLNSFGLTKVPGSNVIDTSMNHTGGARTFDRSGIVGQPGGPRIISIPLSANTKPWIRLAVRATPNSGQTVPQFSGVWVDNVFMTAARDSSATF
jgi:hypothetical protein